MSKPDFEKETLQPFKDYLEWKPIDDAAVEEMKKGVRQATSSQPVGKSGSAAMMFFKWAGAATIAGGIYYALKDRKKETAEK
jgi:hypothetical protein